MHYSKQTYYSRIRRDSACNTLQDPIITSVIDAKKITAWGESGFPARFLGNPPYSGHSANKGKWIQDLLRGKDGTAPTGNYFQVDGAKLEERNSKWLNDDYVKFIRYAQRRIERTGEGVLGFVTNHSYLDNPTFRGMRQSLLETFDEIYLLDLHGNAKKKESSPDGGKDENVFDIQQGVAIGLFVKHKQSSKTQAQVYHADLYGEREPAFGTGKYAWLVPFQSDLVG